MTCPLCQEGRLRILDRHVELSERGERYLGPCTQPEEAIKPKEFPFHEKLAAWVERMNRDCHKAIPMPVSEAARVLSHWTDDEKEDES